MKGRPSSLPHPNIGASSPISGAPACPKSLDANAKKKWKSTVKLLSDAGMISLLDVDLLEMYCEAYSRRQAALAQLGDEFILDGPKGSYQNPVLHVANKALDQMLKLSKQLGLDKLTAKKLGVDTKPRESKTVPMRDRSKGPPPPNQEVGT